jgi:ERCC4-type nuclease
MIKNNQILPRIIVDTREQRPYKFSGRQTVSKKLDIGDYSLEGFEDHFAIERKEMNDFISCMINKSECKNRDRFVRELERAKEKLHRLWILVECDFSHVLRGNFRSELKVASAVATTLAWQNRYPIQVVWGGNRAQSARLAERILERSYRDVCDQKVNCCNKISVK